MKKCFFIAVGISLLSSMVHALPQTATVVASKMPDSADQRMKAAVLCKDISSRIARLTCFDNVFQTPVQQLEEPHSAVEPEIWTKAMQITQKAHKEGKTWGLITEGKGKAGKAWLGFVARNERTRFANNAKPVLMMSCSQHLSHFELALPSPVDAPRIKVSVNKGRKQYWRSDNTGLLLSYARGLPAIDMMKSLAYDSQVMLRSNASYADHLRFDIQALRLAMPALRSRCSW